MDRLPFRFVRLATTLAVGLGATTVSASDRAAYQAIGLGQDRGAPVVVPHDAPRLRDPADPQPLGGSQGRIFLNFDGAALSSGWDDATNDTTQIDECAGNFAAYGDGAKRDAVVQAVQEDWADFNVVIVDSRPAMGEYTMAMIGPTNPFGGGVLGIAPLDCNDSQTHNNIVYAFHDVNDSFSASTTATTIGQEVAHSYGLEHVDEPGDIMNPFNAGGDPTFRDECIEITGGANCTNQHTAQCGSGTSQNSYQELMTLFGASTPDTAAPTVSITAPVDGAEYVVGDDFEIMVDAADDVAIAQVVLFANGAESQTDDGEPYGWSVTNVPEGTYEFYVEASDGAGNTTTSNVVTVYVGVDAPVDPTDAGEEGGSEGGSAEGGSDDGAVDSGAAEGGDAGGEDEEGGAEDDDDWDPPEDGALPAGYGGDGEFTNCACTEGRTRGGGLLLLMMIVLLNRRGRARTHHRRPDPRCRS
jgi:hypothetical protein